MDGHLATYNASGTLSGIDDRSILAIVVGAMKELAATVRGFAEKFMTKELVAVNGTFETLTTQTLCVGKVCVTESDFLSVFGASALAPATESASTAAGAPSPGEGDGAPDDPSTLESPGADTAITTTSAASTSTPPTPEPGAEAIPAAAETTVEEEEPSAPDGTQDAVELAPANDKPAADLPATELPATGTGGE